MKKSIHALLFLLCFFVGAGNSLADYEKIKIAVLPFTLQGENFETEDMGLIVSEWLITAFVKEGRFEVIERKLLGQIMEEQQMAEAGIVSQETATELGKLLGVKVIISGSVMKLRSVLEVNARIIDVASASIVTAENVRSSNVNDLQSLVVQMAEQIIRNFPLEGYIANRNDKNVVIDLGIKAGVKTGMKFIAYKEGEVVRHPKTDEILYVKQNKTGTIKITNVQHKISEGVILDEISPGAVEYGDFVKSVIEIMPPEPSTGTKAQSSVQQKAAPPKKEPPKGQVVSASSFKTLSYKGSNNSELSSEVQSYLVMLKGLDTKQARYGAKKLYKLQPYSKPMLKEVNKILLNGFNKHAQDKNYADAMAWLCKLLANSHDTKYKSTLQVVVDNAENPKVVKHAKKALTLF